MNLNLNQNHLNKKVLTLEINLGWLFFYIFFICYGYFGALSFSLNDYIEKPIYCIFFSFLVFSSQVFLGFLSHKWSYYLKKRIVIKLENIIIFLFFLVIHLFFNLSRINNDLSIDELSYAQSAHRQTIEIIGIASQFFPSINSIKAKFLSQALSLFLLFSNIFLIYITLRIKWFYRVFLITILLIISKFIYLIAGGYLSPHPPIQYITPLIFGSFLGFNNYSFRLAYLIPYVAFISILFFRLKKFFDSLNSFLLTLSISTLPIALNASTIVEQSLWGLIAFTLYLISSSFEKILKLKENLTQAAIFALFRITSVFIFLPITLNYFKLKTKNQIQDKALYIISFLLFGTFFVFSILNGTPTTEHLKELGTLEKFSFINKLFNSDLILKNIIHSIDYWWIFFFPFAFFKIDTKKSLKIEIINILFFFFLLIIFHSLPLEVWEYSKYKLEFFIPFCILGFVHFALFWKQIIKERSKFIITLLCTLLILLNLYSKKSFFYYPYSSQSYNKRVVNFKPQFNGFIKEPPPPYKEAFQYIKDNKLSGNYFIFDTTYGIFNEIVNGFNLDDVIKSKIIFDKYSDLNNKKDFQNLSLALENDLNIKAVIVPKSFDNESKYFESYLLKYNWKIKKEYTDSRFNTKINIYSRSN